MQERVKALPPCQQQGNLFEHAQDKSAWTRENCVCLREIYKPKNIRKNEGSLFAVFYSSTKLIIHFFFLVPTRKRSKSILCHKNLEKKVKTAQKSRPQPHDVEA